MSWPASFVTTCVAPAGGLTAWAQPDASFPPVAHIEARVEMRLVERYGEWAHIECSNGWHAWVDFRLLAAPGTTPTSSSSLNPAITTIGSYTITLLDLIPAVGMVLGALLPWVRGDLGRGTGSSVPLAFLTDTSAHKSNLSVGVLIAVAALIAAAAPARGLRFGGYALGVAAFAMYVVQTERLLHDAHVSLGLGSVIGVGVYVGIVAGCLGLGWTLTSSRTKRR